MCTGCIPSSFAAAAPRLQELVGLSEDEVILSIIDHLWEDTCSREIWRVFFYPRSDEEDRYRGYSKQFL